MASGRWLPKRLSTQQAHHEVVMQGQDPVEPPGALDHGGALLVAGAGLGGRCSGCHVVHLAVRVRDEHRGAKVAAACVAPVRQVRLHHPLVVGQVGAEIAYRRAVDDQVDALEQGCGEQVADADVLFRGDRRAVAVDDPALPCHPGQPGLDELQTLGVDVEVKRTRGLLADGPDADRPAVHVRHLLLGRLEDVDRVGEDIVLGQLGAADAKIGQLGEVQGGGHGAGCAGVRSRVRPPQLRPALK